MGQVRRHFLPRHLDQPGRRQRISVLPHFEVLYQCPGRLFGLDAQLTLQCFLAGQKLAEGFIGLVPIVKDTDQCPVGLFGAWVEPHEAFGQASAGPFLVFT